MRSDLSAAEAMADRLHHTNLASGAPRLGRLAGAGVRHRVVFGLEALREKVVAWSAGIDDVALEAAKIVLCRDVPGLALDPAAPIRLERVHGDGLDLRAPTGTVRTAWRLYQDSTGPAFAAARALCAEGPWVDAARGRARVHRTSARGQGHRRGHAVGSRLWWTYRGIGMHERAGAAATRQARAALVDLLATLGTADDLRLFVRYHPHGTDIERETNWKGSLALVVSDVVERLHGRGLVNDVLFERLAAKYPGRTPDIDAVRRTWRPFGVSAPSRHNLPVAAPVDFVGRTTELGRLHAVLSADGDQPYAPVCLVGLGGMGKTQLAIAYAHAHLDHYALVVWVDSDGDHLGPALARAAAELDLHVGAKGPAATIRSALERGDRTLLILDNLEHRGVYDALIPRTAEARVLATSRRSDLAAFTRLRVAPLPMVDAMRLVTGELSLDAAEQAAVRALVTELGGLTLALWMMRQALASGVMRPGELLECCRTQGPEALLSEFDHLTDGVSAVARLFESSLHLLDPDRTVDRWARSMLMVRGCLAQDPVRRDLLLDATRRVEGGARQLMAVRALDRLVTLGWCAIDEHQGVTIHRLQHAFLQRLVEPRHTQGVLDALAAALQATPGDAVGLRTLGWMRPHLVRAADLRTPHGPEQHLWIPLRLSAMLDLGGDHEGALAVALAGAEGAPASVLTAGLYGNAGDACTALERLDEALEHHQRMHEIEVACLGPDHAELEGTFATIGRVHMLRGERTQGRRFLERALALAARKLDRATLDVLGRRRGVTYGDHLPGNTPDRPWTLVELGEADEGDGDVDAAKTRFEEALAILEARDPDQLGVAIVCTHLARVLQHQDRVDDAHRLLERALDIATARLGPDDPIVATYHYPLAHSHLARGTFADAGEHSIGSAACTPPSGGPSWR